MTTPTTLTEHLVSLSRGEASAMPLIMTWALHQGLRGATWLVVHADGRVEERATHTPPAGAIPRTELGRVSSQSIAALASTLLGQRFDRIRPPPLDPALLMAPVVELSIVCGELHFSLQVPSPQLRQIPALAQIAAAFQQVRTDAMTRIP